MTATRTGVTRKPGPPSFDEIQAAASLWAVCVAGPFGRRWETHYLPCPSRAVAESRAAWWRNCRWDVAVDVCTRSLGEPWTPVNESVVTA